MDLSRSRRSPTNGPRAVPVAVDGALKELHGLLGLPQLPVGRFHLSAHAADAGVALERVRPPLGFLIHHPQHVAPALLGCAQLLGHDGLRSRLEPHCRWLQNRAPLIRIRWKSVVGRCFILKRWTTPLNVEGHYAARTFVLLVLV